MEHSFIDGFLYSNVKIQKKCLKTGNFFGF